LPFINFILFLKNENKCFVSSYTKFGCNKPLNTALVINFFPTGLSTDSLITQNVNSTVKADIGAKGWDSCQVKEITMSNFRVKIDSPSTHYFNFLDSVRVFIANKDGSERKLVAYKGNVAKSQQQLIMDVIPNFNLKPYLLKDSFRFYVGGTKSADPTGFSGTTYFSFDAAFNGTVYTKE
jgi:hypothetical protein